MGELFCIYNIFILYVFDDVIFFRFCATTPYPRQFAILGFQKDYLIVRQPKK